MRYWGGPCGTSDELTFQESYSYNAPGAPTGKQTKILKGTYSATISSSNTYDNEGKRLTTAYPGGPTLTNVFDSMGRLQGLKEGSTDLITNAAYNVAGQMTGFTGANGAPSETRTYNSIGQMVHLQIGSALNIEYNYPSSGNNGKIMSDHDVISGETVTYTYDVLNRLASAESSVNPVVVRK